MRERQFVADLVSSQRLPKMFKVKQKFPRDFISPDRIPGIINDLLSEEKFSSQIRPGMRIAITAGSRGIANVALTTKCIADFVRKRGAHPFIVPAMGVTVALRLKARKKSWKDMGLQKSMSGVRSFRLCR